MASLGMHGIRIARRGNAARLVVGAPPYLQVLVVILAIAGLCGLLHLEQQGDLADLAPAWVLWSAVPLVLAGVLYRFLLHRTLVTVKGGTLAVERRPIRLPPSYAVRVDDIRAVDTDVKVTTRRDKYGNEHDSYRFTVQLSLTSDWRPRRLYRTGSESAAVAFRQTIMMMIENDRAMNRGKASSS